MLGSMRFEDGRATAGWSARLVKDNEQAREGAALTLLREKVSTAILGNEVFNLAARPKALTPLTFARYGAGREYGSHVDNPLMNGIRTDVSFTLFLADPESYDGGELVIESVSGEEEVKLPAGHMILYPTYYFHRVEPVTRGERLACVSWLQSMVRDLTQREVLLDLAILGQALTKSAPPKDTDLELLDKVRKNLLRMWAES